MSILNRRELCRENEYEQGLEGGGDGPLYQKAAYGRRRALIATISRPDLGDIIVIMAQLFFFKNAKGNNKNESEKQQLK